jgi:mannose-6-phosphate isomerase-like protein (cupin superfamily)
MEKTLSEEENKENKMKRFRIDKLECNSVQLLPDLLGERKITHGGVYVFKPGETAHPEYHVHEVDELFIFVQGNGFLPIDGVEHSIETGDVILVESGEDHHTTSSIEAPLVAVWYLFDH